MLVSCATGADAVLQAMGKALTMGVAIGMSYPASSSYGLPVGAVRLTGREQAIGPSWVDDGMILRVSRDFTRHQSIGNPQGARLPVLLLLPVSVWKAGFKKADELDSRRFAYCTGQKRCPDY